MRYDVEVYAAELTDDNSIPIKIAEDLPIGYVMGTTEVEGYILKVLQLIITIRVEMIFGLILVMLFQICRRVYAD